MKEIIDKYINRHSPSYVIKTYNKGNINTYSFGNRQVLPDKKEVNELTIYDIASLTKVFTSTLIYIAYQEKIIDINSNIYDIDNRFINLKDVTILDLLSHKLELWTNGYLAKSKTREEFLDKLYTISVKRRVPTYVDAHYMVLSLILEKLYDKDLFSLMEEKIFIPLNMSNTSYYPEGYNIASTNYEERNGVLLTDIDLGISNDNKSRVGLDFGIYTGHAGLFSTVDDLMVFLIELFFKHNLIKEETLNIMLDHRDINKENEEELKKYCKLGNVNEMYEECLVNNYDINLARPINNMGIRFRNSIIKKTDVPFNASDNSVTFSGYTGPIFTVDLDNKIIIIMMCNVTHNSKLDREERKILSDDIINEIYDKIK